MKVYISVDMEGVAGVVAPEQVDGVSPVYQQARRLMVGEVNSAIEGALAAGADEIVVNDAHEGMNNLLVEEIHPKARYIVGRPKLNSMMAGLDETFDCAVFIGYHGRMGAYHGVLNHSYNGRIIDQLILNGDAVGEYGLNAALAGHFGVPVVAVSGDRALAQEVGSKLGPVERIVVKEGLSRTAALCLHPEEARKRIREGVEKAIGRRELIRPWKASSPIRLRVQFHTNACAEVGSLVPGVVRTGERALEYEDMDFLRVYRVFLVLLTLGGTIRL